ncbi:MAG TPA: hypothetical protein EYG85_12255 [Crocinitomix sp.]|nr:hypothetical protein [Crocinitomix sp.]
MKNIIFILFLLLSIPIVAQIDNVIYGKEYTNNRKNSFNGFVGENNLSVFGVDYASLNSKKYDLLINAYYKNDLSLVESKNIYTNPLDGFINEPLEIFYQQNKYYLFAKFTNKKEGEVFMGLSIFNEAGQNTSFEIIDTIEQDSKTNIIITQSEDKQNFIQILNHPHKVANRQVLELKTFNLQGQTIWQKDLLSTNSVSNTQVEKVIYTNNEVYILCSNGYKNGLNINNTPTVLSNKYTLWVYNKKLNFMKEVVLRLKLKWINGISMALNYNKELIISGFINTSREFGINGVFNLVLNQKYEVSTINYHPFSKETFKKFVRPKNIDKVKYLPNFYVRKLIVLSDGSFFLLGENYYKFIERNYDPRTNITTTTEHFIYGNIMVCYFDNTAKLKWIENVPKSQNTINDFGTYSSYTWINLKDKIMLFYNDNEKNLDLPVNDYFNQKELFNYRRNMQTYVLIDKEGVVKRGKLNQEKTNFLIYAKRSKPINNSTMYLCTDYGRHSKIISVSFK